MDEPHPDEDVMLIFLTQHFPYPWYMRRDLSKVWPFENASEGPDLGEVSSHVPWVGKMLGEEEEHDIFVGVGFVQIDFTGQGSLWKIREKK